MAEKGAFNVHVWLNWAKVISEYLQVLVRGLTYVETGTYRCR